jgi:hypothetical protein
MADPLTTLAQRAVGSSPVVEPLSVPFAAGGAWSPPPPASEVSGVLDDEAPEGPRNETLEALATEAGTSPVTRGDDAAPHSFANPVSDLPERPERDAAAPARSAVTDDKRPVRTEPREGSLAGHVVTSIDAADPVNRAEPASQVPLRTADDRSEEVGATTPHRPNDDAGSSALWSPPGQSPDRSDVEHAAGLASPSEFVRRNIAPADTAARAGADAPSREAESGEAMKSDRPARVHSVRAEAPRRVVALPAHPEERATEPGTERYPSASGQARTALRHPGSPAPNRAPEAERLLLVPRPEPSITSTPAVRRVEPQQTIQVSIGRVEIRQPQRLERPAAQSPPPPPRRPAMSLDDYLERRNGSAR